MSALVIDHLVKSYGATRAVDNVSFSIKEGDFFGFLGPNGAGKTSTIHSISGVARFNSGTIKVFGKDVVKEYREARALIGLSPQEFNVDIFAPVNKILWYVGGYYGVPSEIREKRIEELVGILGLGSYKAKQFRMLSGGLKRRVLIARALIHDPKLLILDEPSAGVDVELRHELWAYVRELNRAGKTILLTSHYLEEVETLCQRVAIIFGGKIIAIGNISEFTQGGKTLEKRYLELTKLKK